MDCSVLVRAAWRVLRLLQRTARGVGESAYGLILPVGAVSRRSVLVQRLPQLDEGLAGGLGVGALGAEPLGDGSVSGGWLPRCHRVAGVDPVSGRPVFAARDSTCQSSGSGALSRAATASRRNS